MLTSGGEELQRLERPSDLGTDDRALHKYWMMEIDNSGQVTKNWEQDAERICKIYRDENRSKRSGNRFNILAANVNTMKVALYNSTPIPDIRRRNEGAPDPVTKDAADVMERAVSLSLEDGRFDQAIRDAVMDLLQVGRGLVRVRNTPLMSEGEPVWYSVCAERVPWRDFRCQPEADWSNVNWCAFRHYLDREQLEELNPTDGAKVRLDYTVSAEDTGGTYGNTQGPTDTLKRAVCWEIWDKRTRRCLFVAPSWKKRPLKIEDDPLRLEQFFPMASPIWADKDPDSMVPLPDFRLYEDQASELDEITRRIQALIRVCKWRGIYNSAMGMIASLESADDGDLKPVDMVDPTVSLDSYVWLMPIQQVVEVLQQLYVQRKEILGTIYEITGLSDIIRGNTDPSETLGSQRIKAQWASGKLSTRQGDVARLCRDIIRLKTEIIVEHWPPEVLSAMTGIMVTPEIQQLLTSDQLRMWKIDVETDSTIQADLTDARENIGQLIEGIGGYITAIAPAVQGGLVTNGEAIKLLAAFSKPFRLGRTAEQVFDEMVAKSEQQEQAGPQAPPPDPAMLEVQGKMQIEQQKLNIDVQHKAALLQHERDKAAAQHALEVQKAGLDPDSLAVRQVSNQGDMQLTQAKTLHELQMMEIELANKRAAAFADEQARQADADRQRLEKEAFIATKRAEIAKAETAARAAAEIAEVRKQIEIKAAMDEAAAAENERQALAQQRQIDIDAQALTKQAEIAEAQARLAQAQAEARSASEIAEAKTRIELQSLAETEAATLREQLAVAEDARRHREIDEKVYLREKEAEVAAAEAAVVEERRKRQAEMEVDALRSQTEIARLQAELAKSQAEAQAAEQFEAAKNQIMLQSMAEKEAAALRDQLAITEDARRRREIEEKAFILTKEAEMAKSQAEVRSAGEVEAEKNRILLQSMAEKEAAALRDELAVAEDARRRREIEEKAYILTKEAEMAKSQAEARSAGEIEAARNQIAVQSLAEKEAADLRDRLAIAEDARRRREIDEKVYLRTKEAELAAIEAAALEKKRQIEMEAEKAAIENQVELARAQADLAVAQAEAARADEIAKAKAQIELQALMDKNAAAAREELALAEDARRRREIDEKAYLRIKEAELADTEAKSAASRAQSQAVSTEALAKQETLVTEIEKLRAEFQMMIDKAQLDAEERANAPARQEAEGARADALAEVLKQQAEMLQTLVAVVAAPKMVVRNDEGAIVGTRTVIQ